eukprot:scaffold682_cov363-Pavlova_lutheri.AAC.2
MLVPAPAVRAARALVRPRNPKVQRSTPRVSHKHPRGHRRPLGRTAPPGIPRTAPWCVVRRGGSHHVPASL